MPLPADPPSSPWEGAPPDARQRSRALRQAVGRGTGLVLLAGALVVGLGAWPVIEAVADGPRAATARRGLERAMRQRGWAVGPPEPTEHRVFGPSHLSERGGRGAELLEDMLEAPALGGLEGHSVRARGRLALLKSADAAASPVATIDARVSLLVLKDDGPWLLLAVRQDGQMLLGWAPRESIVTLP